MKKLCIFFVSMLFITCNTSESSKPVFEEKVNLEEDSLIETTLILDSISTDQDSLINFEKDSVRNAYENDLSLEIKEIEEEKIDPISEDCMLFLEDYVAAISSFSSLLESIDKNPENINLIIARSSQEEQMYAYSSNPQMFQCIQNEAFQKQVDILNNKRDKLISK
jgi:hypothetical protein